MTTFHDWVTEFGFWCLPSRIQFGFSITSCYPRKPQGPIGHSRPLLESLYFLQTRLRGREGKGRRGREGAGRALARQHPNTVDNSEGGREDRREEAWSISSCTLTHKSNIPALSLLLFLSWLQKNMPQSSVFSFQLLPDEYNSGACYLKMLTAETSRRNKSNVLATHQITNVWEMTQLFLMQLYRG